MERGPADIDIVIVTGEPWPIFFQLKHNQWEPCGNEGAGLILERLVNPVIEALAVNAKLPPVISRENLFGYALWMYVNVLKETKDLRLLTGYEEPASAMESFSRLTCCLYKEVPGCDKCPYCPL